MVAELLRLIRIDVFLTACKLANETAHGSTLKLSYRGQKLLLFRDESLTDVMLRSFYYYLVIGDVIGVGVTD